MTFSLRSSVLKKSLAILLLFMACMFLQTKTAHASHGTIPNNDAPMWVQDIIHDKCVNQGWNIVQLQWISPRGAPASSEATVVSGAASVPLQLNRITYRCRSSTHSYGSSLVVSTNPSISALNGLISDMPYPANVNTASTAVLRNFDYPGPFTTSRSITITLNSRGTTTYSNGAHYCAVVGSEPRVSTPHQHNFTPQPGFCAISTSNFTLNVKVVPTTSLTGTAAGRCTDKKITGTAEDRDKPSLGLVVQVFIDGEYEDYVIADGVTNAWSFDISPYINARHEYTFFVIGVNGDGNWDGGNAWVPKANPFEPLVVGPCPQPVSIECGAASPTITNPEPGESFNVRVTFEVNSGTFNDSTKDLQITNTGGLTIPAPLTKDYISNTGGTLITAPGHGYAEFGPISAAAGQYVITYQLTGTSVTACTGTILVTAKPYLRVFGGDVLTGIGFEQAGTCPASSININAEINAFNRGSGFGHAGAGGQLAVFALSKIDQFASANLRTANPSPPKGLTFGNDGEAEYGGNWVSADCAHDFWSEFAPPTDTGNITLGAQTYNTNINRVIDGNLYINGNITMSGGSYPASGWPHLRLIVRGNIYIAANVSEIDAVVVAQPNTADPEGTGIIYTCAPGFRAPTTAEMAAQCGANRLTIRGALSANKVKFLRHVGTLRNATASEIYSSGNIAEIILYTPEVWLSQSGLGLEDDGITGLPPIL